jgi:hypothetical protein
VDFIEQMLSGAVVDLGTLSHAAVDDFIRIRQITGVPNESSDQTNTSDKNQYDKERPGFFHQSTDHPPERTAGAGALMVR